MSQYRLLYLPIEIKARELLGKVWFAARAAERGWIVVMGDHKEIRRYALEGAHGIHVEISIPERKSAQQEAMSRAGQRLVNICEESIIYTDGDDYCLRKVGATSMQLIDRLFSPGMVNAAHVERCFPAYSNKVFVSGNPRFDTLRPELRDVYADEANALRAEHGPFLLANTNFGRSNPAKMHSNHLDYLVDKKIVQPGAHLEFHRHFTAFKHRQFLAFRQLLAELARSQKFPKIFVRPHPSENHDSWREWGEPLGIEVKYDSNANIWAMAADAVLHPGCTTGIEAMLLDRPVISYISEPDSIFVNLADSVTDRAYSADEIIRWFDRIPSETSVQRRQRYTPWRSHLEAHIANADLPYAADRILNELDRIELPRVASPESFIATNSSTGAAEPARDAEPKAISAHARLKQQKNSGLTAEEISVPADIWLRAGQLKRTPQIRPLNNSLFVVF
jgi:surface carbohydrate biosynthesis protein